MREVLADEGLAEKHRRHAHAPENGDLTVFEHPDLAPGGLLVDRFVRAELEDARGAPAFDGRRFDRRYGIERAQQRAFHADVSRILDIIEVVPAFLELLVGGQLFLNGLDRPPRRIADERENERTPFPDDG